MSVTIGLIGSNGQVGMEVTLLLRCMSAVDVVPVTRSAYSAAFLTRCGVEPRVAADDTELADVLAGCDVVADFSVLSGGTSRERRASSAAHIRRLVALSPPRAKFVYASSITAFGMPEGCRDCRYYRISRTRIGAEKRRDERELYRVTRSTSRVPFVLRLGEVHGDLQPVTSHYVQMVRNGVVILARGLRSPSNAVTCTTIATSLRSIAQGLEEPGLYTVVEQPEWSWDQFFRWVAVNAGAEAQLAELPGPSRPTMRRATSRVLAGLGSNMFQIAARNRDVITSYVPIPPSIEYRFRIGYQRRKVASEVSQRPLYVDVHDQMLGPVPGRRLRTVMGAAERRDAECCVRRLLDDRLAPQSHHFLSGVHWAP
jgi:hypothetical protein